MKILKVNLQLFGLTKAELEARATAKAAEAEAEGTGSINLAKETIEAPTVSQREAELEAIIAAMKADAAETKATFESKLKEMAENAGEAEATDLTPEQYLEQYV